MRALSFNSWVFPSVGDYLPVAAFLYLFGLWHVYRNLEQSGRILAKIILGALALTIIVGGAYHAVWPAYSLVLKAQAAATAGATNGLEALSNHLSDYMGKLYLAAEAPGFFGAALLFYAVLFRKTHYPRWMALLNSCCKTTLIFSRRGFIFNSATKS